MLDNPKQFKDLSTDFFFFNFEALISPLTAEMCAWYTYRVFFEFKHYLCSVEGSKVKNEMILCTVNAKPLSSNHFHWLWETIPFKILLHFKQGIHGGRMQSVSMVLGGLQHQFY